MIIYLFAYTKYVQEEVDVFEGLFPLAGIVPRYVTEVEAVNLLLKDSLRLAITSRRLTPEEVNSFNSRKFFPQEIKIATDGLALITNRENPDTLITVNEIRSILTGKVTQWKEIYPASRLKDIRLVFDNKNSSTVRFAVDSICKGAPLSDQVKALKTNREVIDFVSKTPDTSRGFSTTQITEVSRLALAHTGHSSASVKFWQMRHRCSRVCAPRMASASAAASLSDILST